MQNVSILKYFDDKLEQPKSPPKLLPLFHSCDAMIFRSILESKKLQPSKCNVFEGEDLLYLFYGRPAYKKRDTETNRLSSYLPVSLILDWDYIPNAKRIAPFDTGAFVKNLYKEYMHHTMPVDNFFMRAEQQSVTKTTNFFFGKNSAYYAGNPKVKVTFDKLDFEVESYLELIKGVAKSKADDRKATIEVQLDTEIVLNSDNLKAAILPSAFKASKLVKDVIVNELNAQVISYDSYSVPSSDNYTNLLTLTKNYLMKNKYFLGK